MRALKAAAGRVAVGLMGAGALIFGAVSGVVVVLGALVAPFAAALRILFSPLRAILRRARIT